MLYDGTIVAYKGLENGWSRHRCKYTRALVQAEQGLNIPEFSSQVFGLGKAVLHTLAKYRLWYLYSFSSTNRNSNVSLRQVSENWSPLSFHSPSF